MHGGDGGGGDGVGDVGDGGGAAGKRTLPFDVTVMSRGHSSPPPSFL